MFDRKTMKMIKIDQIHNYIMKGVPVYMVMADGMLMALSENPDAELLFFHVLRGGSFAVYRKKLLEFGTFNKSIKVGRWTFSVDHEEKETAYDECREG